DDDDVGARLDARNQQALEGGRADAGPRRAAVGRAQDERGRAAEARQGRELEVVAHRARGSDQRVVAGVCAVQGEGPNRARAEVEQSRPVGAAVDRPPDAAVDGPDPHPAATGGASDDDLEGPDAGPVRDALRLPARLPGRPWAE